MQTIISLKSNFTYPVNTLRTLSMAIVSIDIPMFRAIIFEPASSSLIINTNTFNFKFQGHQFL